MDVLRLGKICMTYDLEQAIARSEEKWIPIERLGEKIY